MLFNRSCCSSRQNGFGFGAQPMPMTGQAPMPMAGQNPMMECPVVEPTITQCQEREFYHEIPQV